MGSQIVRQEMAAIVTAAKLPTGTMLVSQACKGEQHFCVISSEQMFNLRAIPTHGGILLREKTRKRELTYVCLLCNTLFEGGSTMMGHQCVMHAQASVDLFLRVEQKQNSTYILPVLVDSVAVSVRVCELVFELQELRMNEAPATIVENLHITCPMCFEHISRDTDCCQLTTACCMDKNPTCECCAVCGMLLFHPNGSLSVDHFKYSNGCRQMMSARDGTIAQEHFGRFVEPAGKLIHHVMDAAYMLLVYRVLLALRNLQMQLRREVLVLLHGLLQSPEFNVQLQRFKPDTLQVVQQYYLPSVEVVNHWEVEDAHFYSDSVVQQHLANEATNTLGCPQFRWVEVNAAHAMRNEVPESRLHMMQQALPSTLPAAIAVM